MERPPVTRTVRQRITASPYTRAVALHLTVRAFGVVVLALLAGWHDVELLDRLTAWDGQWYLQIAENGYAGVTGQNPTFEHAPLAFFPLYPMLISLVGSLPGLGFTAAALVVSVAAGSIAACGLVRLARVVDPRPVVGLLLVALLAGAPMAITLSMAYTEALFIALAVWALVAVLERDWLLAGVCAMFAGFTRSTAAALILVVAVAAVLAAWRGRDRWKALACVALCPLGLLGYWGYVAAQTGSLTGWQDIEARGWGMAWDWGAETAGWFVEQVATGSYVMTTGVAALLVVALVLVVVAARCRLPWQLVVYGAAVVALVIGTGGLEMTKARLLLPAACVLLLPVAIGLANRQRSTMLAVTVAFVACGVWFSAYSLTGWQYAI